MRRRGVVVDGTLHFELSFDLDSDSDMEELEEVMRDQYSQPSIKHLNEEEGEVIVLTRPDFRPHDEVRHW